MSNDGPTILVCDDEPHILHVVSTKLRNAGYRVITAEDGAEALDRAVEQSPLAVVSDLQMPEMSGLELARALRDRPETSSVPVLLLTARGFVVQADDLAGTNIRFVLPKPFSPREVLGKVEQLLASPVAGSPGSESQGGATA